MVLQWYLFFSALAPRRKIHFRPTSIRRAHQPHSLNVNKPPSKICQTPQMSVLLLHPFRLRRPHKRDIRICFCGKLPSKFQLSSVSQSVFHLSSRSIVQCFAGKNGCHRVDVFVNLAPARRDSAAQRQRKYPPGAPALRVQVLLQAAVSGAEGWNRPVLGVRWQ